MLPVILADGTFGLLLLGLWLFCIIDVITTPVPRNLPKFAWLVIVLLLPDIGSIAWLVAGRVWPGQTGRRASTAAARAYPEYDRANRAAASNPDDDEAFLAQVRSRAEAQRREYEARRKRELAEEQDRLHRRRPDPDEA